jgi:hypothetical protein
MLIERFKYSAVGENLLREALWSVSKEIGGSLTAIFFNRAWGGKVKCQMAVYMSWLYLLQFCQVLSLVIF